MNNYIKLTMRSKCMVSIHIWSCMTSTFCCIPGAPVSVMSTCRNTYISDEQKLEFLERFLVGVLLLALLDVVDPQRQVVHRLLGLLEIRVVGVIAVGVLKQTLKLAADR